MEMIYYRHQAGAVEALRPTHAIRLAAGLGKALTKTDDGFTARSADLAEAARRLRDEYRCRTVRKELRRIGLLGVEGVADRSDIAISCSDDEVVRQMEEAGRG